MSRRGERLPVILMFLLLIALPFLFQDPTDGTEPRGDVIQAEERVQQPPEKDGNGRRNLPG